MSSGHQIVNSQNNTSVHQTSSIMAQASGAGAGVTSQQQQQQASQQQQQGQQQQQQQIHLQQSTTTTQIHAGAPQQQQQQQQQQHHHTAQATNPMQQLQLIQQPLQNQYLQQLQYSTQQGGQILMNGNLLHHPGLNSQIQVIAAGKTFQSNQLGHQILNTSYTAIPTTAANNQQAYIIGQLINSQGGLIQQTHQQPGKPGEMPKVLSPQIGTQLPQGLWTSPHFITSNLSPNPIFIRGGQQDQMFIQQQPSMHTNTSTHQHFSMQPITTPGQIPTSMANAASIQAAQQQQQQQQNANVQQAGSQQQQGQQIAPQPIQPQPANVVSIKGPATLQPKPLQIQPQPAQSAQQQQQQQQQQQTLQQQQQSTLQQQIQQVTMAHSQHQLQIIPQPPTTTQTGVLSQPLITGPTPGTITMQTSAGHHQIQTQQTPRHLTILPQQQAGQTIQSQVSILQQSQQQHQQGQPGQQQHQPIRPNFTIVTQGSPAGNVTVSQVAGPTAGSTQPGQQQQQQQRPKAKKVVSKGGSNASTPNTTPNKTVFPRPVQPATSVAPITSQYLNNGTLTLMQAKPTTLQSTGATLTKVNNMPAGASPTGQQMMQPLKTINISALHSNLPDATLTPLMPSPAAIAASVSNQVSQQPVQVYPATTTQLPSPVVSITPAPPPPQQQQPPPQQPTTPSKKDEAESAAMDTKNDTEKENAKTNGEESEDTTVKQNKPPKAMVKPQVLTHVIEGFVIQEASEPFPMPRNGETDEPPKKKAALSIGSAEMGKCEMCGKVDLKAKFKKNKRFCSSACAKSSKNANQQQQQQTQQQQTQLNNNLTNGTANNNADLKSKQKNKKWADFDGELTDNETNSSVGDASILSPTEDQHDEEPKVNPVKWSVSEVVEFVKSLPGCSEYAEDFAVQEIDGQALLLLKEDHLMSAIGMKLGPALKLCAKIEGIRSSSGGAANGDAGANKA